jgi:hypothetical protein
MHCAAFFAERFVTRQPPFPFIPASAMLKQKPMRIFHHIHRRKLFSAAVLFLASFDLFITALGLDPIGIDARAATTLQITLPFWYEFKVDGTLEEAGSLSKSWSPYWWLNSGAYLYLKDGIGSSVQGSLPAGSKWQLAYQKADPGETDNGYHPQNIFRLFTRTAWQDVSEEVFVRINKYNLSDDSHRAASNGILLINRFSDGDNLYYAGIRVDGYAVIKKKVGGTYYTMAYKPVILGKKYDRMRNPNLLPVGSWIGVKTEVKNLDNGQVSIKFYTDIGKTGTWFLAAEAVDDGQSFGGAAFTQAGNGGVRTDFMDIDLDDYRLFSLN